LKYGSATPAVRRVQRALNTAGNPRLSVTGILTQPTVDAIKAFQARLGMSRYGVVSPMTWDALVAGRH
ncbi:MAG: peptidoglycan-binding protein, partial [Actinomycetota bacterium]|nr:peptidoglycan-binding protein [Actinomycetota bacterium]